MRAPMTVAAVCVLLACLSADPALAVSRTCGSTTVSLGRDAEGSAVRIVATRVSCKRARLVARQCVRGTLRGWRRFREERDDIRGDRIVLERGSARVSFFIAGGSRCDA